MNHLTCSVIHSLAVENHSTNWVFSPASYLEATYGLTYIATGKVQEELLAALDLKADNLEGQIAMAKRGFSGLESYNALLFGSDYRHALVKEVVDALVLLGTDLKSFNSRDEAIAEVNRLVREKTRGKIDGLANRDNISEFTKLILLNCVYFKQDWMWEFDKPLSDSPFYNADGSVTQLGLLQRQEGFHYYEDPLFDVVEIPYRSSDVCCYLFVPTKAGSVFRILDGFDVHYTRVAQVKRQLDCHVTVPPFKMETTVDLIPPTKTAGIYEAFEETQDWRVLDWAILQGGYAKVDAGIQKVYIDFTRKGTEAAAATMWGMYCISGCCFTDREPPRIKYIRANRPFVYALANKTNPSVPLFVGAVNGL